VKIDIRWQLLLVVICLGLVISLLSYQIQGAGLCTTRVPSTGGRLGVGMVGRPDKINPLLASSNPVDLELINLIFDGLVAYDEDGYPVPALAASWQASDDGKTLRFVLRDDVIWHDGQPFTASDVTFTYGLLQNDDFPAPESLKSLWKPVVISSTSDFAVDLILPQPYGPFLDATTLGILPAHLLEGVPADQLADHVFNKTPIGTGPFAVSQIFDWEETGQLRLIPDPERWQGDVKIDTLDYRFYPDIESVGEAFSTGAIQAISGISPEAAPEILALPLIRVFTSPGRHITQLLFNLSDSGSSLLSSPQGRRALSSATNRPLLIDEAVTGQGLPLEGPYVPGSWAFNPEVVTPIPYDPTSASAILEEMGWHLAEGTATREKEGSPLRLNLLVIDDDRSLAIAESLGRQWAEIGIEAELIVAEPDEMTTLLSEKAYDVAIVNVQTPGDPDLYDFWSQEAIVSGQNYGEWNNRRASEDLENGRQLYSVDERLPHYNSFLQAFSDDLPAFTLLQSVNSFALSETIEKADVGHFRQPRDRYDSLARWFMLYREVAVACSEDEA
jgi:peptide/nickel transport system substrate-binding protein